MFKFVAKLVRTILTFQNKLYLVLIIFFLILYLIKKRCFWSLIYFMGFIVILKKLLCNSAFQFKAYLINFFLRMNVHNCLMINLENSLFLERCFLYSKLKWQRTITILKLHLLWLNKSQKKCLENSLNMQNKLVPCVLASSVRLLICKEKIKLSTLTRVFLYILYPITIQLHKFLMINALLTLKLQAFSNKKVTK